MRRKRWFAAPVAALVAAGACTGVDPAAVEGGATDGDASTEGSATEASAAGACSGPFAADPANCGAAGRACIETGCICGLCDAFDVATGVHGSAGQELTRVADIAVDASGVYWTDDANEGASSGGLWHCPLPPSPHAQSAATLVSQRASAKRIALGATGVFFTVSVPNPGVIMLAKDTFHPTNGVSTPSVLDLAAAGDVAFVASSNGVLLCPSNGAPCGDVLAGEDVLHVAARADGYCVADRPRDAGPPTHLVCNPPPDAGGATTPLADDEPITIALSSTHLLWITPDHAAWAARGGGATTTVPRAGVVDIDADDANVYFADASSIYRCPIAGCPGGPEKIAGRPGPITALAVYDGFVWFGEGAGETSRILRVAK